MTSVKATWPTGPLLLSWRASEACDLPVTGSHGFCFSGGKVLVCNVRGRGWSIPGGHLEAGETPHECLRREIREEACAEIEHAVLAGFLVADHSINSEYAGPYPTRSALAMFAVTLGELKPYVPAKDTLARQLVELDALPTVHHQWDLVLDEAYTEARRKIALR
jgi:ADP-ribose pyrophosphatase YjhB (NUDIX family)